MERCSLLHDGVRDALLRPFFQNVGAVLGQLAGEVSAHYFHHGPTGALRQLRDVVIDLLVSVAGIGEHGTERATAFDGAQVNCGAVLPARDVNQVLDVDGVHGRIGSRTKGGGGAQMGEFLWWTFIRCWPLGEKCEVNWDAWAAAGTVLAVFVAVLTPSIQRSFVRRRANAMFALAFRGDVLNVKIRLTSLREAYPMGDRDGVAWAVERLLSEEESNREDFLARAQAMNLLTDREVDLTRWPAVDVSLAAKVALAIESVRHLQIGAVILSRPGEVEDWDSILKTMAEVLERAIVDVEAADEATVKAMRPLRKEQRAREKHAG